MVIVYPENTVQITLMDLKQYSEKMISSLRDRLHNSVNTVVASHVSSPYFILSSPLCAKWNMQTLCERL